MEKKRKLPARAAARVEQAAKRRNTTPPQRSATPASAPEPEPTPVEEPPAPLPKSITAGKPLPTVDSPQPDDLSNKDYQSVTESGVLAESLSRSRQKWTSEGIFEKYWSKPTKRKGVVHEEPNNPPKESMTKLGQVTITVEPHVFEATMFAVKDPKPPPPAPPASERPIIQYGPPNGVMPPPSTPKPITPSGSATPAPAPPQPQTQSQPLTETKPLTPVQSHTPTQTPTLRTAQLAVGQPTPDLTRSTPTLPAPVSRPPVASPRGMESVLSPVTPLVPQGPVPQPQPSRPIPSPSTTGLSGATVLSAPAPTKPAATFSHPPMNGAPTAPPANAPGKPAPGTDPIILTLAEKAGMDPQLRDLMKRVAQGEAAKHELERFQAIIDAITAESKRKGSTAGPSADRLLVDGRTVRYFADEVRTILDIVLSSNPKQTSANLQPPAGSDPLVVMLVKTALDDLRTRDMVRRIAENKPHFSDATDLQAILERLRANIVRDREQPQQQTQTPTQVPATASPAPFKPNNTPNGQAIPSSPSTAQQQQQPPPQQALRSKGPPPPPAKPDISAIVLEFAGGTGDRYLFPKFSLLEYVPVASGQQVIASFLLVRKGSKAEYPMADPELDYYQPVTIRLFTHTGRHLEHLARVVAPREEVLRYMDDVMSKMTRAEYVLLAMRLPRSEASATGHEDDKDTGKEKEKDKEKEVNGASVKGAEDGTPIEQQQQQQEKPFQQPGVLWKTKPLPKPEMRDLPPRSKTGTYGKLAPAMDEDTQYQGFIKSISRKEAEA